MRRLARPNHQLRDREAGPEKLGLGSGLEKEVKSSDYKPFSPVVDCNKTWRHFERKDGICLFFSYSFWALVGMDIDEKGIMPGVDCNGT